MRKTIAAGLLATGLCLSPLSALAAEEAVPAEEPQIEETALGSTGKLAVAMAAMAGAIALPVMLKKKENSQEATPALQTVDA